MPSFQLNEVTGITGAVTYSVRQKMFSDLVSDTRRIQPGVLFWRLRVNDLMGRILPQKLCGKELRASW